MLYHGSIKEFTALIFKWAKISYKILMIFSIISLKWLICSNFIKSNRFLSLMENLYKLNIRHCRKGKKQNKIRKRKHNNNSKITKYKKPKKQKPVILILIKPSFVL